MKGDFTRYITDHQKHFTRVLIQQGRPSLDADWNEQVDIYWNFLRGLAADMIGPHGGPEIDCGFRILAAGNFPMLGKDAPTEEQQAKLQEMLKSEGDFLIGPGRYYVEGMPCTNSHHVTYSSQAGPDDLMLLKKNNKSSYLVFVDAWEMHRMDLQEESIREVALLGSDTATRAKLVWTIGLSELEEKDPTCAIVKDNWHTISDQWQPKNRGMLRARAVEASEGASTDPSTISPGSGYRGMTNQLYRVEVHHQGKLNTSSVPTFKFSRENGSVVFPIKNVSEKTVTLRSLGRDDRSALRVGDWVELVDDDYELQKRAEPLLRVEGVFPGTLQVTLSDLPKSTVGQDASKHPLLRRWDHKEGDIRKGGLELRAGAAMIKEGEHGSFWLNLEHGVQIQFHKTEPSSFYRTGDYWTIPARVATGNVEWPHHNGEAEGRPPQGTRHYYAPLAILSFNSGGVLGAQSDCRLRFKLPTHYGESVAPYSPMHDGPTPEKEPQ
jgi:hypothetical protein